MDECLTGLRVEHVRPLFAAMLDCINLANYHAADPAGNLDQVRWILGRALVDALIPAASDLVNGCNPRIAEAAGIDVATDEVDA